MTKTTSLERYLRMLPKREEMVSYARVMLLEYAYNDKSLYPNYTYPCFQEQYQTVYFDTKSMLAEEVEKLYNLIATFSINLENNILIYRQVTIIRLYLCINYVYSFSWGII